jgi:spore coat protein U-like protein
MQLKIRFLALVALIATFPSMASAAPVHPPGSRQLQIFTNVAESCTFNPIPAIALGNYDWRQGIETTVGGELSVMCNRSTFYSFTADRGLNSQNGNNNMSSGSKLLAYSLLVDNGSGAAFDPANNLLGREQTEVASGRTDSYAVTIDVPARQMVPAGAYDDTVTFSLNY